MAWFVDVIDKTFSSGALSRRTKLLILAVVSRTMDCGYCEMAACDDLRTGGMSEKSVESILETLGGPDISDQERLILDWARETVRYRTSAIQKRTRSLASEVSTEVLLESIGAAAVSNMAVRMAMLLE